jgi:hypothetical protein
MLNVLGQINIHYVQKVKNTSRTYQSETETDNFRSLFDTAVQEDFDRFIILKPMSSFSAFPSSFENVKTSKRQNVKTKKRQNVKTSERY